MRPVPRKSLVTSLLVLAVFLASAVFLLRGIRVERGDDRPAFLIDEAHKIGESYFGHLFLARRDVSNPLWTGDFYARTNPTVPKYLFFTGLALAGNGETDLGLQAEFERSWKRRNVLRSAVADGKLRTTRRVSALFGALAAAALFFAGRRLGGTGAGLAAVVLFLGHPDVAYHGRVGLPDSMLWFFAILALPVSWRASAALRAFLSCDAAGPRTGRVLRFVGAAAVLPGVATALAVGTKLNGALVGLSYAGTMAAAACASGSGGAPGGWRRWGSAVGAVLGAAALSVVLFVAINPYYYRQPLQRARETLRLYEDWTVKQQVDPGGGLLGMRERLAAVGVYTFRSASSPAAALAGRAGAGLTALACLAGILLLGARAARLLRTSADGPCGAEGTESAGALLWAAACIGGTVLWLPLAWIRYLLLPYLAFCLLAGVGLGAGLPVVARAAAKLAAGRGAREGRRSRTEKGAAARGPASLSAEGAPPAAARSRAAALALLAASWAVLMLTPCVIRPELIPPASALTPGSAADGIPPWKGPAGGMARSAAACHGVGLSLSMAGRSGEALRYLDRALALTESEGGTSLRAKVRASRILMDLARARGDVGDRAGTISAVRRHRGAVLAVRDAMVSGDPKIREEYDAILSRDDRLLERLESPAGGA